MYFDFGFPSLSCSQVILTSLHTQILILSFFLLDYIQASKQTNKQTNQQRKNKQTNRIKEKKIPRKW